MPSGAAHTLPAEAREVFDVSGAGDTVVATLAAALAAGASLRDAAELANVAAGIVVGKVGTAVAHAREVAQALRHRDLLRAEAKIMEPQTLLRPGGGLAPAGTAHRLHQRLLRPDPPRPRFAAAQARAACDRLVVGLNTDASVARLKGPGRPVQPEMARAAVLASLAAVDAVVLFDEETPLALIELLRPDVLVKGADYRLDEVVGAELVQGYGGRVLLAATGAGLQHQRHDQSARPDVAGCPSRSKRPQRQRRCRPRRFRETSRPARETEKRGVKQTATGLTCPGQVRRGDRPAAQIWRNVATRASPFIPRPKF